MNIIQLTKKAKIYSIRSLFQFACVLICLGCVMQSCVTAKAYEDAMLIGEGNQAVEATLSRAMFQRPIENAPFTSFINSRDVGTVGLNYIYGMTDRLDVSVGADLPVGIHVKGKYDLAPEALRHIHAVSLETRLPTFRLLNAADGSILLSVVPSYLYTYRYDDLFNVSVNAFVNTTRIPEGIFILPGIAAGIGVGDELRFSAGFNYSRTIFATMGGSYHFLTVESSIKYDF